MARRCSGLSAHRPWALTGAALSTMAPSRMTRTSGDGETPSSDPHPAAAGAAKSSSWSAARISMRARAAYLEGFPQAQLVQSGSSIKFCRVAEGRGRHLSAARADAGLGYRGGSCHPRGGRRQRNRCPMDRRCATGRPTSIPFACGGSPPSESQGRLLFGMSLR